MPALAAAEIHRLLDRDRPGVEGDVHAEFAARSGADPVFRGFPVANDASGNMPSGAIGLILTPRKQRAALVLNEKVHIHQRRVPAQKKKELFR